MPKTPDTTAEHRDLELLEIIEQEPDVNQRNIARRTSMALGLVNSCLKRLARKGLVKIQDAPGRRYLYYLTPKGMTEKSRLTYEYVRLSIDFYSRARRQCRLLFEGLAQEGVQRVAFVGRSDLAEIAYLSLQEHPITFVGLYDTEHASQDFFGQSIQNVSDAKDSHNNTYDVLIYTGTTAPQQIADMRELDYREIF